MKGRFECNWMKMAGLLMLARLEKINVCVVEMLKEELGFNTKVKV